MLEINYYKVLTNKEVENIKDVKGIFSFYAKCFKIWVRVRIRKSLLTHNKIMRHGSHVLVLVCVQVIQRREDGSVNFFRGWEAYRDGFGQTTGEHWLGGNGVTDKGSLWV